ASPRETMLAHGVDATVPKIACASKQRALPGQVAAFLSSAEDFGRTNPMVVGAVPFSDSLPAHLVMPSEVVRARPLSVATPGGKGRDVPGELAGTPVPSPAEFEREVRRVSRRMGRDGIGGVVLARLLEMHERDGF